LNLWSKLNPSFRVGQLQTLYFDENSAEISAKKAVDGVHGWV
jgi:hypothetical protein